MNRYQLKFAALIKKYRGRSEYDILVSYSGGKDSSFILDLLKNEFGLKVLAFTFDNGFISSAAQENIHRVVEKLGVDHILVKPRFDVLKKIFATAASSDELYSRKSLERASPICTACISLVKSIGLRMAIEKRIPLLGFGWSPGQAPIQSSVMRLNPSFVNLSQKKLLAPLCTILSKEELGPYFLTDTNLALGAQHFPWNVHPLAFLEYSQERIFQRIEALGWQRPADTGVHSTNCLLNSLAIENHKARYHFHPYAWEIANLVRSGRMSRAEGLERIRATEPSSIVDYARERLGLVS
ncbi:MAG: hypothetical protein K6U11_03660 [bacterium]|nr:hypothetical protein [bacterium]